VDHHVLSVDAANDDRVARMGSVYGLLDGLTRPNDRAARATPLATNTVRAMVVNNTMVRLIKKPPLL
jgi:hypothetical protein